MGPDHARAITIRRPEAEPGRCTQLVELGNLVTVDVIPGASVARPADRVDALQVIGPDDVLIPIGCDLHRGHSVTENVVHRRHPGRDILEIGRAFESGETAPLDEDRLGLAGSRLPAVHGLEPRAEVDGQLRERRPSILREDSVLPNKLFVLHGRVRRVHRVGQ